MPFSVSIYVLYCIYVFFQSDCQVILKPSEIHVNTFSEIYDAINKLLKPELLNDLRVYLTTARNQHYEITENMMEVCTLSIFKKIS